MYFCIYQALPKATHPGYAVIGGAYVHCWIQAPSEAQARRTLRDRLNEAGWEVQSETHLGAARREDYLDVDDGEALACFDEAERTGEAYMCITWPPENRF